jgi:hypothetical protein
MYSAFDRTQRAFTLAVAITAVLAFAPRGLLGWTGDVAEIVRVPTRPFSHLGVRLGTWFRPPAPIIGEGVPEEARALVEHLQAEVDRFKQLYAAEQLENLRLRDTLEQIQLVPVESRRPVRLLTAAVVAHAPTGRFAPVQLNRGSAHGVRPGAIALFEGVHLVGRISDVTPIGCTLVPLVNPATGVLQARVQTPERRPAAESDEPPAIVHLEIAGDGTLFAAVDETMVVQPGFEITMADPMWPDAADGMMIGTVTAIEPIEDMPLRKRVVVTPRYHVSQLPQVTLKVEVDAAEIAGADGPDGSDRPAASGGRP